VTVADSFDIEDEKPSLKKETPSRKQEQDKTSNSAPEEAEGWDDFDDFEIAAPQEKLTKVELAKMKNKKK
jgi:hypothetical protein